MMITAYKTTTGKQYNKRSKSNIDRHPLQNKCKISQKKKNLNCRRLTLVNPKHKKALKAGKCKNKQNNSKTTI